MSNGANETGNGSGGDQSCHRGRCALWLRVGGCRLRAERAVPSGAHSSQTCLGSRDSPGPHQGNLGAEIDSVNHRRHYCPFSVPAWLADQIPNSRSRWPSGSNLASSRTKLWPHKEYFAAASVTTRTSCSNASALL